MRNGILFLCFIVFSIGESPYADTSVNPDISVVGDFRVFYHDDQSRHTESEKLNITDPEIELNIGGQLNHYARADMVFGWHGGHNAEIEEAHATVFQGLPLNANLRVGKYLLEFGRLNPVHPHDYSFIKRPLPHETFFGEEGLSDMAIRALFTLPTGGACTEIMGGLLKGDALSIHEHEEDGPEGEEHDGSDQRRDLGFFGRLTSALELSESSELAVGGSVLNAVYGFSEDTVASPRQLRSWIIGGDIKYEYVPSQYRSLQIEAEGIMRRSDFSEDDKKLNSYGAYGYVDYHFNQKYNVGGIFEWARTKEADHREAEGGYDIERHETRRLGLFVGFAPEEETTLVRLAGHRTDPDGGDSFWEATLQLIIGLGPHGPHDH
jgi:hypothetical protein